MRMKTLLFTTCLVAACPAPGWAQAPPSPATPPPQTAPPNQAHQSRNCAPTQARPNDGTIAPHGSTTGQSEPLGDRLAKSNGVLCPPTGIDPEMHAPTPETGKMPVIPPPGSPGGNQNVQPK
ncbi:MAG: hypothetical protein ACTHM2_02285 [Afipia sp.]